MRPIFKELEQKYKDRLQFVELDVDKPETEKQAKTLKISWFYSDHINWFPAVGVFSPKKRKLVKELLGTQKRETYEEAIEKALAAK